jgi:hypothetical protein
VRNNFCEKYIENMKTFVMIRLINITFSNNTKCFEHILF